MQWKGHGSECDERRDESGVTAVATDAYWARVGKNTGNEGKTAPRKSRKLVKTTGEVKKLRARGCRAGRKKRAAKKQKAPKST